MSFYPISYIAPNYRDYDGWWIKAYQGGTTTPIPIYTDSEGGGAAAKLQINSDGFIVSSGGLVVNPYIEEAYSLYMFPTAGEADNNDTTEAIRLSDDQDPEQILDIIDPDTIVRDYQLADYTTINFDTVANAQAGTLPNGESVTLKVGDVIRIEERDNALFKGVSSATADGYSILDFTTNFGVYFELNENQITVEMFGSSPQATRKSLEYAKNNNIGEVRVASSEIEYDYITLYRNTVLVGSVENATILTQTGGSLTHSVTSENFDILTGTGASVNDNDDVPSWLGAKNITFDGNKGNGNVSAGLRFYGAAPVFEGVVFQNFGGKGMYTEYTTITGEPDSPLSTQEEGRIDNVIARNNDGDGWLNRGPHNVYIENFIGCFNGGYGYYSEKDEPEYNGAPTYANVLHCYANDIGYDHTLGLPRKNIYIGTNMSCGLLVVDGGYCEIASDESKIALLKQYLGGQGNSDGVLISGDYNEIACHSGIMRNDEDASGITSEACVLRVTGNFNQIPVCTLRGSNIYDEGSILRGWNGIIVEGTGNKIKGIIRDSYKAVTVEGTRNELDFDVVYAHTTFDNQGTRNRVKIRAEMLSTFGGVNYTDGNAPTPLSDEFDMQFRGLPVGTKYTTRNVEYGGIDNTLTTVQTYSIPHGLAYTPRRQDCTINLAGLAGVAPETKYIRISSTDADNVNIELQFSVAGTGTSSVALSAKII